MDDPVNANDPMGLASKKYAGADSEAGLSYRIGGLVFNTKNEQLDVLDDDGFARTRMNATSGHSGVTDATLKNRGPIPPGGYNINPAEISETTWKRKYLDPRDWGEFRAPLYPNKETKTFGRSDFFIHGGKKPGSNGCVDVGKEDKNLFPLLKKQKKNINLLVK